MSESGGRMRFLITGGAGFIGSHLARRLMSQGTVTILDNLSSGRENNLAGFSGRFLKGSILDPQLLDRSLTGITHVFHLAAMVSVPESVAHPARCNETNVVGTRKVLEAATRAGVKRVVFASSCAIYGNEPTMPKNESLPPAPASPYAESKLVGEKFVLPPRPQQFHSAFSTYTDPVRILMARMRPRSQNFWKLHSPVQHFPSMEMANKLGISFLWRMWFPPFCKPPFTQI